MGFQRKGRNPQGNNLPSVSEGTRLSPSHINDLAAGVDKVTLRSGKGYRFTQSAGGTSLQITNKEVLPPWTAFTEGWNLCIKAGNVWGKGIAQMPKHISRQYGFARADFSQKFWTSRPVMVDVPQSNILCTDELNAPKEKATGFITFPLSSGIYYIEYSQWDGGDGEPAQGSVAKELAGTEQFILKVAPLTSPPVGNDNVFIICVVDERGDLYQGVVGDIWSGGDGGGHAFKISIFLKEEGDYRVKVKQGAVNNVLAKYANLAGSGNMDEKDGVPLNATEGVTSVFLTVRYAEGENFPASPPEVVAIETEDVPIPTEEEFTILLGRITATTEGSGETEQVKFNIQQIVTGSLWVERFVVGDAVPIYWATKV